MDNRAAPTRTVAECFTGLAQVYAEFRPTYPAEAIAAILKSLPKGSMVADIGCGTGISSRLLAQAGARVIGIDPNQDMLAQARRETALENPMASEQPIDFRQGTGEDTTLETATVDVVVCAQSFHWFDAAAALKEFHRILRRSPGRLALMWNVRDDDDAFTAEYGEVCKRAQHDARNDGTIVRQDHHGDPTIGGWFDHVTKESFSNAQFMDLAGILGRVRSASYFPKAGPLRTELEALLQRSFDRHQRDGKIALRYRAEFTTAIRIDA